MTSSASVSAAMRNSFCISNILLEKFERLQQQAEADLNITDVVQSRGDVAVVIVFRRRERRDPTAPTRAQIFGLALLLFGVAPALVGRRRNAARRRNHSILPKRTTRPVEIRRLLLVLLPLAELSLNLVST